MIKKLPKKILLLSSFALFFNTFAFSGELKVGASAVDITPRQMNLSLPYFVHLAGYSPYYPIIHKWNRIAEGIHDSIWSRAIAIEASNGVKTLWISTDLPGLTWKHINPVRRRLSKEFGIPFSNIIIASTHDHAAPDAAGYWVVALKKHNHDFTMRLREQMYESGKNAILSMTPALMKLATTTHLSCYNPKTKELKKDPECKIAPNSTDYNGRHKDEFDLELIQKDKRDPKVRNTMITVLNFVRKDNAKQITTLINWHNHPDSLGSDNRLVSSDFPHYIREYVEAKLGGIAVYFTGTLGCQIGAADLVPAWSEDMKPLYQDGVFDIKGNPVREFTKGDDRYVKIRGIGYEVGYEVVKALNEKENFEHNTDLQIQTEQIDIAPVNFLHFLATKTVWTFDVEKEDRMKFYYPRCMGKYGCVRSDVSLIQFGDLSLITAPGEIDPVYFLGRPKSIANYGGKFGDYLFPEKRGAKEWMKGPHYAVFGEANNYLSYLLPQSDNVGALNFKHPNHYEEFVTINKRMGDDIGNLWMRMLGSKYRYNKREIYPKKK